MPTPDFSVQTLDLRLWLEGTSGDRLRFLAGLQQACETLGFVIFDHHPLPQNLISRYYELLAELFMNNSPDILMRYARPETGHFCGYVPKGVEKAKDQPAEKADLKAFLHQRREYPTGHPRTQRVGWSPNIWPSTEHVHADFRPLAIELFGRIDELGRRILEAINTFLDLPPGFLSGWTHGGETLHRPIYYPKLPGQPDTEEMGTGSSGLEVQPKGTDLWVPVNEQPGQLVMNIGDMLELFTSHFGNGIKLVSTTHRVVNPTSAEDQQGAVRSAKHQDIDMITLLPAAMTINGARFAAPTFIHPDDKMVLRPDGWTAGGYRFQRYDEIGLLSPEVPIHTQYEAQAA